MEVKRTVSAPAAGDGKATSLDADADDSVSKLDMGALVRLSIGGKKFTTTVGTLSGQGKLRNFFTSLLSGHFPSTMDGKAFFIDRDGKHFGLLLEWLRSGKLPPSGPMRQALRQEAAFYSVDIDTSLRGQSNEPDAPLSDLELADQTDAKFWAKIAQHKAALAFIEKTLFALLRQNAQAALHVYESTTGVLRAAHMQRLEALAPGKITIPKDAWHGLITELARYFAERHALTIETETKEGYFAVRWRDARVKKS